MGDRKPIDREPRVTDPMRDLEKDNAVKFPPEQYRFLRARERALSNEVLNRLDDGDRRSEEQGIRDVEAFNEANGIRRHPVRSVDLTPKKSTRRAVHRDMKHEPLLQPLNDPAIAAEIDAESQLIADMQALPDAGSLDLRRAAASNLTREERALLARLVREQAGAPRGLKSASKATPGKRKKTQSAAGARTYIIRNRKQAIFCTRTLVAYFEEELSAKPTNRLHNNPPANALLEDDAAYLNALRELIAELKRLNALLEKHAAKAKDVQKGGIEFAKNFNRFLAAFAVVFGTGAGGLALLAVADLLQALGMPMDMLPQFLPSMGKH